GALHDLEPDTLAFLQAAKPLRAYRGKMHENVSATAIGCDESETLGVVEPLHGTHCHFGRPLFATIVSRHGPAAWLSISRAFATRKRHFVTPFAQSARSADTIAGTCPVAAARCTWISSRLIGTSGSGPQHADQFATVAAHARDFRAGFQPRPLRGSVTAAVDHRDAGAMRGVQQGAPQRLRVRLTEFGMQHRFAIGVAKTGSAPRGVIDQLVGNREYPRTHVVANAAHRIHADHAPHAEFVQGIDIGAIVDAMRRNRMPFAMACEERDALAFHFAHGDRRRRLAPARGNSVTLHVLQARKRIHAGAADDGKLDGRWTHASPSGNA